MVKKIISVATAFLMLCCMVPFYAFAESATCPKCGKDTLITNQDISVEIGEEVGLPLSLKRAYCSNCHYAKYEYNVLGVAGEQAYDDGDESHIINFLKSLKEQLLGKNATASKWTAGGGSTDGSGVGRPKGYAYDNGTPTYNSNGELQITVYPRIGIDSSSNMQDYPGSFQKNLNYSIWTLDGLTVTGRSTSADRGTSCWIYFDYRVTAPVSGTYYIASEQTFLKHYLSSSGSSTFSNGSCRAGSFSQHFATGVLFSAYSNSRSFYCQPMGFDYSTVTSYFQPLVLTVSPDTITVNKQTNITINNNTWNGNIYVDNSNNLTYIYPEYTTINENNETVTNISNNPIIYNNETQQYYTYDSTTNNYYYITYNDTPATPTPSPSPSPSPSPTSTPDPSQPTPTPTPGGDTGDTTGILAVLVEIRDNMIQGFLDLKATLVQGWADLSANFTLAIENLNLNITNIFNKKFPDQSTPETAAPSPSPSPSPSPAPVEPILPDTQNYIIPKMNSNTFTDEHGTWIASGSSKYSDVFDFFRAFDRSTELWETNVSPSNLQIEIPDPENYYIDGYIMKVSKFTNRYAKEWTLQGSDDGETWNDLDTQTGQNLSDQTEHKYSLALHKSYKYYRLNMSNYASSMCSLSHFNLLGYDAKDVVTPTPSPSPAPDPSATPTPTPAPTDKPSGGDKTNNFWTIIFPSGGDDSSGEHKGIFWALVSLILALIAFFTNLAAGVGYLFPFLPDGVVLTINTCLFVIFLFVIVKFIMRSK